MSQGSKIALYALLCFVWGSTWMVIKVGYGGLGPFTVAAIRFFAAGLLCAAIVPLVGARWPRARAEWLLIVFVGVVMFGGDYGLIYWSEQYIDSGLTAILFATLPLITIAVAHWYVPGERITSRKLTGTMLAFIGVVALFGDHVRLDPANALPMAAVVLAAVCAAAAGAASKVHGHALHPAALNGPSMLVGAGTLAVAAMATGEQLQLPREPQTLAAIAYLTVMGSVVSFLVYFSLLKTWSVTSLSFISVFTPAIALTLGFVFLDERPTLLTAIGGAFVLAGVALALTGRPEKRLAAASARQPMAASARTSPQSSK
jgi:drug/metabolite transporter (DMT)-like permease